jgi:hypothetical protein
MCQTRFRFLPNFIYRLPIWTNKWKLVNFFLLPSGQLLTYFQNIKEFWWRAVMVNARSFLFWEVLDPPLSRNNIKGFWIRTSVLTGENRAFYPCATWTLIQKFGKIFNPFMIVSPANGSLTIVSRVYQDTFNYK